MLRVRRILQLIKKQAFLSGDLSAMNLLMSLAVRISSYGMHLGSLEGTQEARTLTHLSCSPNFPRASITRYTHAKYEQILNLYKINLHCICTHENPTTIC